MDLRTLLKQMIDQEASDLFLTAELAPSIKVFGHIKAFDESRLSAADVQKVAAAIMNTEQQEQFRHDAEMNLAIEESDIGRFRVNIYRQRGQTAMVFRHIKTDIPTPEQLGLPDLLKTIVMEKRGLILFVGGTGTGKSTSLAALIGHRNRNSDGHIITVEDPIEFIHPHARSIVSQREVGIDTLSYENALQNTLRQAPDVILIGEIRSQETMDHAIAFAETGHLCLATLHANNANQALDRIINFFPEERHQQLLMDLSLNLKGLISQRLIPSLDGRRAAAFEILLGTPRVCDLIKQGKVDDIKEVMEKSEEQGMRTFDSALYELVQQGRISQDEALRNADSRNNLRLRMELAQKIDTTSENNNSFDGLALRPKD
ncbi:PilT/PilU family type 4a pilus ATPase [Pseudohongiella spirulinae]|uniref:Twitching motility protein n=1 Tax=Pseudohongiella spirulinae TaxID=1249552 RepID=A0A0S2KCG7_9GAMM|nr:PilT/PilU family type 4a pilus ATPase [Pseudohongiella spirulinae]ALO46017.1 Twitching motility protein [Pseudohongiella spirulinae]